MSTTIEDRFELLLKAKTDSYPEAEIAGRGRWDRLAEMTGIAGQSWRSAFARRQKPTLAMLMALAHLWPEHAFWLVAGITDAASGHIAPPTALAFPERGYQGDAHAEQFFRDSIALQSKLTSEAGLETASDSVRLEAFSRERVFGQWWDGALLDTAYGLAAHADYQALVELWQRREEERRSRIARLIGAGDDTSAKPPRKATTSRSSEESLRDPRTAHQGTWDLFYRPKDSGRDPA